ncbi:MAG: glycine cleavage system protein GcvH [Candidatus Thermoplasmatota archaeon]
MTEIPDDLVYSKDHEWIKVDDGKVRYGITDHAQDELGDIVYVELPEEGEKVEKGDMVGVIESVKAVSDLYIPISGEIMEVNKEVESEPELLNEDPYGEGWIAVIEIADEGEVESLLSAEEYEELAE